MESLSSIISSKTSPIWRPFRGIGPGGIWAFKERGDVDEVSFKMNRLSFY
jgi:hypothetical protein